MKAISNLLAVVCITSLFIFAGCKKESNPVTPPEGHFEAEGWLVKDSTSTVVLAVFRGVVLTSFKGAPVADTLYAPNGSAGTKLSVYFLDSLQAQLNPPVNEPDHSLGFDIAEPARVETLKDNAADWAFRLKGKSAGKTQLKIQLLHEGHADITTPYIPVMVR